MMQDLYAQLWGSTFILHTGSFKTIVQLCFSKSVKLGACWDENGDKCT